MWAQRVLDVVSRALAVRVSTSVLNRESARQGENVGPLPGGEGDTVGLSLKALVEVELSLFVHFL